MGSYKMNTSQGSQRSGRCSKCIQPEKNDLFEQLGESEMSWLNKKAKFSLQQRLSETCLFKKDIKVKPENVQTDQQIIVSKNKSNTC